MEPAKSIDIISEYVIYSRTNKDGIITEVSDAFCDISGYSKEELIGKDHNIIKHPDMPDSIFQKMWSTIVSGKVWQGDVKNLRKDGTFYWVSATIAPEYDDTNNEIVSYISIRADITAKKELKDINKNLAIKVQEATQQLEEQYQKHKEEIINNTKFSTIGQMAAGITHEINTPLTYLKGTMEMARLDIESLDNSDVKERLLLDTKKVTDGLDRIAIIIESMREVSQKSIGHKEDFNVYSTLITVLRMIYNRSKQIVDIYVNGELFVLESSDKEKYSFISNIHKQRIEQVWTIILNNALDELVKIEGFKDRKLNITIELQGDNVKVSFQDNAGGVPESIKENIFEPFVSTKESSGIGIGLNVAKKIVDEHNAKIKVVNQNGGACFEVTL